MPTCVWHRPEFRRPSTSYVEQSPLCTPWDYRLMIPSGQSLRTMRICQELRYSNCYYVDPTTNTVGPLPRVVWQCDNVTLWFNKFYKPLFKEKMLQLSHQHKDILAQQLNLSFSRLGAFLLLQKYLFEPVWSHSYLTGVTANMNLIFNRWTVFWSFWKTQTINELREFILYPS